MSKNKKNHARNLQKKFLRWKKRFPAGTILCYTNSLNKRVLEQLSPSGVSWVVQRDSCVFYEWTDYGLEQRNPPNENEALLVVENLGRGQTPYSHIWYLKILRGEKLGKVAIPFYAGGYLRSPENFFDLHYPASLTSSDLGETTET